MRNTLKKLYIQFAWKYNAGTETSLFIRGTQYFAHDHHHNINNNNNNVDGNNPYIYEWVRMRTTNRAEKLRTKIKIIRKRDARKSKKKAVWSSVDSMATH